MTGLAGAASTAVRPVLTGPRHPARVLAVFPAAIYLELGDAPEPRVVALVSSDAMRPPNAIALAVRTAERPFAAVRGDSGWIGDHAVELPGLRVEARRWWDPALRPGTLDPERVALLTSYAPPGTGHPAATRPPGCASPGTPLDAGPTAGTGPLDAGSPAGRGFGLAGHADPPRLAEACRAGDVPEAVRAARSIVGLGPGLTPSGDDVLAGLLAALRTFGPATLADAIGAAVTPDAAERTTALSATLLHCAAHGLAGREVAAVLNGLSGREPLAPPVTRLLGAGHTSGADLLWGITAGCHAALGSIRKATA